MNAMNVTHSLWNQAERLLSTPAVQAKLRSTVASIPVAALGRVGLARAGISFLPLTGAIVAGAAIGAVIALVFVPESAREKAREQFARAQTYARERMAPVAAAESAEAVAESSGPKGAHKRARNGTHVS